MNPGSHNVFSGRPRVAVIGSGVAGLTAAYVLQRSYDVTLYEADDRLGGHAHTQDVVTDDDNLLAVDTGFIVHNQRTYPKLLRLFAELGVETQPSEMSMSVRCDGCNLEYAGARGPTGLFAQRSNAANPRFLRMLVEVKRFHREAAALLDDARASGASHELTLGAFLATGRYSQYFTDHFMLPLVSAVWSTGPTVSALQPAHSLFEFFDNHGMLSVTGSPTWKTVVGGSRNYVDRVAKQLPEIRHSTSVRSLRRSSTGIELRAADDSVTDFDKAVVATHSDQALMLLADPTELQQALLAPIAYTESQAWLHTDTSILPRASAAQASWNYRKQSCTEAGESVLVSYDMNRLMRLPDSPRLVVTLNGAEQVDEGQVLQRMRYQHPVFTSAALAARDQLPKLNDDVLAFAGAYHGWGFHEDGCASGVRAAASLGVQW
jgi:predicted NAD/FAD-binding protein